MRTNNTEKSCSKDNFIVSLTSYGRRVKTCAPYAIYSMLRQSYQPDKIILWLNYKEWNDRKLPLLLSKLKQKKIVDIKYCSDCRSYTKLIPALNHYPNAVIVTIDDDIYYSKDVLKRLYEGYMKEPSKIYSMVATYAEKRESTFIPYRKWKPACYKEVYDGLIFPLGYGGKLYPPKSLHHDVCREDIFKKLSPSADDIWFWFMALMNGTQHGIANTDGIKYYPLDLVYQKLHKGAALSHENVDEDQNDTQLKNILSYYNIEL